MWLFRKDIEDSDNNLAGEDVIDEIDSILLDDATTPLITSGKLPDSEKGSNGDDLVRRSTGNECKADT